MELVKCYSRGNRFVNEAQNLLGYTALYLIECRPSFQNYVLPPSSGRTSETAVDNQFRTRQYIPENSELHTRCRENLKSHRFINVSYSRAPPPPPKKICISQSSDVQCQVKPTSSVQITFQGHLLSKYIAINKIKYNKTGGLVETKSCVCPFDVHSGTSTCENVLVLFNDVWR
jgi:hypothetical protein